MEDSKKKETPEVKREEDGRMPKKAIVTIVILAVLASLGIAFGIIGMILKVQAENNCAKVVEEITNEWVNCMVEKPDEPEPEPVPVVKDDTDDYIYINEWGIKIKKPENSEDLILSYGFDPEVEGLYLIKWGEGEDEDVSIIRTSAEQSCYDLDMGWSACFILGDSTYIVGQEIDFYPGVPQGFYEFVTNPDNYSMI